MYDAPGHVILARFVTPHDGFGAVQEHQDSKWPLAVEKCNYYVLHAQNPSAWTSAGCLPFIDG